MVGEKKRRELARQETLRDIVEYVRAYQYSLNAAVAVLSAEAASAKQSRTVGVGRTQIWPCFDGAFVAISRREDRKIIVEVNEQLQITMADLFEGSRFSTMYDPRGWPTKFHIRVGPKDGGGVKGIFTMYGARVVGQPGGPIIRHVETSYTKNIMGPNRGVALTYSRSEGDTCNKTMRITNLFSKRQKKLRGEVPDVFIYDAVPQPLRVQVVHIVRDAVGTNHGKVDEVYNWVHDALARE